MRAPLSAGFLVGGQQLPRVLTPIQSRPLVMFSLAFAAGIAGAAAGLPLAAAVVLIVTGLAGLGFVRNRPLLILAALAACGIGCGALRDLAAAAIPATDASRFANGGLATVEGIVASDPDRLPGRRTFVVQVRRIVVGDGSAPVTGQVFVTELLRDGKDAGSVDYGDALSARGLLETPLPPGNPGQFSWRDYLFRRGIHCTLLVKRPQSLVVEDSGHGGLLLGWAAALRERVIASVTRRIGEPNAAVLLGILIGRRTNLPPDLMLDFVHTGTVHILASAGLHVGIVAGAFLLLGRLLTLPRKLTLTATLVALVFYAMACGGRPSVTRAAIMAGIVLGGMILEREPDIATGLAAAAFAILAWQPLALLETGFQMTFFTVTTLAVCMPVWDAVVERFLPYRRHPLRRALVWTLDLAGVSLVAQIGAAPVVAMAYHEVSCGGFVANLLVVPILFLLIPLALLALASSSLSGALGGLLFTICAWMTGLITGIVRWCGEADWAYRVVREPPVAAVAVYYAGLFAVAFLVGKALKNKPQAQNPDAVGADPVAAARP